MKIEIELLKEILSGLVEDVKGKWETSSSTVGVINSHRKSPIVINLTVTCDPGQIENDDIPGQICIHDIK